MRTLMLAAGTAALALAMPAAAQEKGGGKGNDKGKQGQSMKADRGHGGGHGGGNGGGDNRGQAKKSDDRGNDRAEVRGQGQSANRGPDKQNRGNGNGNRGHDRAVVIVGNDEGVHIVRRDFDAPFFRNARGSFGCPPGLDRKDNGCLPPGQAKKFLGAPLNTAFRDDMIPYAYRSWYRDDDDYFYRMGDGYIYRIDRGDNLVSGLIPLFGAGYYAMGDPWPQPYNFYNVPQQYRSYWADSDDYYYRYGDGAIYRLDPTTQAVNGIVALLAGDLGVGSRLPMGYDVYNVPMSYRAQYYDTPNDWYRYNDGYIYRVDPTTRLITAVIDAIV